MNWDNPTRPLKQSHIDSWKTCTWDFLGGERSWSKALAAHNAEKKAKKAEATKEELAQEKLEQTPGGTPQQ